MYMALYTECALVGITTSHGERVSPIHATCDSV